MLFLCPLLQSRQQHCRGLRRQATERFIQNQYFRLHGECAGNDYPLGFPPERVPG